MQKECEEWEKMKPQKTFMIIEAEKIRHNGIA
jgi:hypothetical protein